MTRLDTARNEAIGLALGTLFQHAVASERRPRAWVRSLFSALARQLDIAAVQRRHGVAGPFVAVQPSVLNHAETPRRWPRARFIALIDRLQHDRRAVVLLGDRHEAVYAAELAAACGSPPRDLVGRTTLSDAVALILASEALVCHDGGLLYIANALAHPTVALIGPSSAFESAPFASATRIVSARMRCAPCIEPAGDAAALRTCRNALACMDRILVEEVLASLPSRRDLQ